MKKQQITSSRAKSVTELKAEAKRLKTARPTGDSVHTSRLQRKELAQIKTIIREKEILAVTNQHE